MSMDFRNATVFIADGARQPCLYQSLFDQSGQGDDARGPEPVDQLVSRAWQVPSHTCVRPEVP